MSLALMAGGVAVASVPPAPIATFIACPIYRDTDNGRKSGCWLADDISAGIRWDVTQSAAKPDWNYAILVEGYQSTTPDNPCGAKILDPVRTSVLEDMPCTRHVIPAEGFPGRKFALPKRNLEPLSKPRPGPSGPFANRTIRLFFDWNSSFVTYQRDDYLLDQAVPWLRAAPIKRIIVTGYAALDPVAISGRSMAEGPGIAQERAAKITEALLRLGMPKDMIVAKDGGNGGVLADADADNLPQSSRRRVEIQVEVGVKDQEQMKQ